MVLIICTKNESNLTNRYWDMVSDRQKVQMDGRKDGRMDKWTDDAKTISLRPCRGMIKLGVRTMKMGKNGKNDIVELCQAKKVVGLHLEQTLTSPNYSNTCVKRSKTK